MRVFLSWSGEVSKAIAEVFSEWLPSVLQAVKPFSSPDDIEKGARWSQTIAGHLDDCFIGLLFLTRDNLTAPWLMFEAGALSKSLSVAKVSPLLFGIEPIDLKGPLQQFQATPFNEEETRKLVETLNRELGAAGLAPNVLASTFIKWWPDLNKRVQAAMKKHHNQPQEAV